MIEAKHHNKKFLSLSTSIWKIDLKDFPPFIFLEGFLALTKMQAMILQARQIKPRIR